MEDFEAVLTKIEKLLALSASPNANEAAAAAAKAQALMQQYNIELAAIEEHSSKPKGRIEKFVDEYTIARRQAWMVNLIGAIAQTNLCHALVGQVRFQWIGRKADIKMCSYLYHTIGRQIEDMAYKATQSHSAEMKALHGYLPRSGSRSPKAFRTAFVLGCVQTVAERLQQGLDTFTAQPTGRDLVVSRQSEIDAFLAEMFPNRTVYDNGGTVTSYAGFVAGVEAGKQVTINRPIDKPGNTSPMLNAG